ncbi:hypothetical protein HMPREF9418_2237 [Neisseria macacae ATCC 33926]|uniref:Uncharacterized protein n=1 Tax=Neisseria macacae ATCC 33926 TaxID=997348 RepID=A0AA36XKL5_9NEIS|nr:hypothetical protein HMPREF9418_2237 [Neisseria macacae ATCC 33926]
MIGIYTLMEKLKEENQKLFTLFQREYYFFLVFLHHFLVLYFYLLLYFINAHQSLIN